MSSTDSSEGYALTLSRVLNAPPEVVFKAWTTPEQLQQWWGPHGMTTPVCLMDPRPGGVFKTVMRSPDGQEYPSNGVFLEVVEPSLVVFTDAFEEGWIPTADPFLTAIVTFEAIEGGKTRCTARALHRSAEAREKHEAMGFHGGWGQMFERLETLVTGEK